MARLEHREMAAVRWLLGQLLVLVGLAGSYALDLGADVLITTCLVLAGGACLVPSWVEAIPRLFWRISPFVILALIVTDFILSGGDILPPLFRMVLLLTLYRALQVRTPREDLQLLLLTLFLLILTGVLSQEITFGLQMLFFAPLAMGQLFTVNLSSREPGDELPAATGSVFSHFSWARLLKHAWRRFDRGTMVAGFLLFLMTTGLALLLFILLPRFDIGAALPFPRLQTKDSLTGFTDTVRYGDVASILSDDTIAMRVDVDAERPPARPYWRMVVLDAYYSDGFMVSPRVARHRERIRNYRFDFGMPETAGPPSTWTLYLEGGVSSYLPAGDSFRSLRFKNRTSLEVHELTRVYKTLETNANTLSLRYEDVEFGGTLPSGLEDIRLSDMKRLITDTATVDYLKDVTYPQTLLTFPEGTENVRIMRGILRAVDFRRGMTAEAFTQKVSRFLQARHAYGLQSSIPPGEGDRLLRWVESDAPGHCELYAGALVLICRYAGFPARLVTGFAGGDWNGFENYYMVRNRHAHAWCEVYDSRGEWIRADPTPGGAVADGSVEAALAGGRLQADRTWQAYLDSLRILWFRRVIQFDSDDQTVMAEAVKGAGTRGVGWIVETFKRIRHQFRSDLSSLVQRGHWAGLVMDFMMPLFVLVFLALLGALVWRRSRKRDFEGIIRRKAGRVLRTMGQMDPPRDNARLKEVQLIRFGPVSSWPDDPAAHLRSIK